MKDLGSIAETNDGYVAAINNNTEIVGWSSARATLWRLTLAYSFNGFFQPVDNPGASPPYVVNRVKAGSAVPVKFSLGGDRGLDIFDANSPGSKAVACTLTNVDDIEQTVSAGGSELTYDPTTDVYTYVWKTDKSWSGTCRELVVSLRDGSAHSALFNFTK
jgi:hypothetical protein